MRRSAIRAGGIVLLGVTLGAVIATLAIARREALNFVHPPRQPVLETPADVGLTYREVILTTDDGLTLRGWYIPGRNGAAIIAQHGYGGTRQGMLTEAAMLNEHGYAVLLFDWRGHGQSEGDLVTFGVREILDVRAALDWLQDRPDLDDQRIGALGDSLGAVALLYSTARLPEIKAVVAVSPFPSLSAEVAIGVEERAELPAFPFAPLIVWFAEREADLPISSLDLTRDIGRISPRPVFLLHGGRDTLVPPDSGELLYRAARKPKAYWFDPEVGHVAFAEVYPEEYERRVTEFFDRWLGAAEGLRQPSAVVST